MSPSYRERERSAAPDLPRADGVVCVGASRCHDDSTTDSRLAVVSRKCALAVGVHDVEWDRRPGYT
jgi:hypothetical protein